MRIFTLLSSLLSTCILCASTVTPSQLVDTRVGTAASETKTAGLFGKKTEEFGQTIPAVLYPNARDFWTPQTRDTEHKCVAPYYYADSKLQGFRNSHWIVGGCTQDYGSMTLMPLFGKLRLMPEDRASAFSHDHETARPDYYSVLLPDEGIIAELTATPQAAIFRFTYQHPGKAYIVVNPNSDEAQGYIKTDIANGCIEGNNPVHRIYQGKGEPAGFSGYFTIQTDKRPCGGGTFKGNAITPGSGSIGFADSIGAYLEFDVKAGETIIVKAASSFVSSENARLNLIHDLADADFDTCHKQLADVWDNHLGIIEIDTDNQSDKEKFYGALYRASFLPHRINDVNGEYPAFASDHKTIMPTDNHTAYYDGFSQWDTYRALHPLLTLTQPAKSAEMMQSLVNKYEQGDWLPIFPCWNSYTAAMIGDHCTAAICDAWTKGVRNFDIDKAYQAMRKNAFDHPSQEEYRDGKGRRALASYLRYGYIPVEDSVPYAYHRKEQTSRTLEYAFDDFALAKVAEDLGYSDDYAQLITRAANYKNVINPATGYADGRRQDGTFTFDDPFDFSPHITEGAPCHYTWYVPHDPYGLMLTMGGKDAYVQKLDSMFSQRRYWHGNEPCHQVAFMYNYAGQPWKTSREVRNIMLTEYLNTPGGLSGNDDAGQMSAWYVFAALGFYPVCPATPYYMLSGPALKNAVLHLENGRTFEIKAPAASDKNIYIKSATLNGKPYTRNFLTHDDIIQGGVMEFEMSDTPNPEWGSAPADCPPDVTKPKMKRSETAGIYLAYPTPSGINSPAPKGFKPFYISHYGRHGSRWITDDYRYLDVINPFDSLHNAGKLTDLGEDVRIRLHRVWEDAKGRSGCLSPLGERQHHDIGKRMALNYPEIFADSAKVNAVSSTSPRCAMSMSYFTEALKEQNPSLRVHRCAYDRDMAYIAHTSAAGKEFSAADAPWREEYKQYVDIMVDPSRQMLKLMTDTAGISTDQQRELMYGLYWIASDMQDVEIDESFYDIFTLSELENLWRTINARMYACNAEAPLNQGVMTKCAQPLLNDIVTKADTAINSGEAYAELRFGHDTHLLRLLALMGIPQASGKEHHITHYHEAWQDYLLSPMAANIQLVFFRNDAGEILVKLLLNEEEATLPIESECAPYYSWPKLREYFINR